LDGDEWKTVTDATKFDQPYVKARPPAQGVPALFFPPNIIFI
jgi:hypothetical protein